MSLGRHFDARRSDLHVAIFRAVINKQNHFMHPKRPFYYRVESRCLLMGSPPETSNEFKSKSARLHKS